MIELSKIKPGDEITIRVKAHEPRGVGWAVRTLHDEQGTYVAPEHIVSHTPKALSVGDRATHPEFAGVFQIIAVDGDAVWAKWADGDHHTVPRDGMERAQ